MEQVFKVAGIGELLWDMLPSGRQAGGAPFNFAYHAGRTKCKSFIYSAVGKDILGEEIIEKTTALGIDSQYIQINDFPTGTVTVRLDDKGTPDYTIHENVAWDYIIWNETMRVSAGSLDAVCFGTLAQRNFASAQSISLFLNALKPDCLKVFDINLRQNYFNRETILSSIKLCDVLKLNDEELPVVIDFLGVNEQNLQSQLRLLLHCFDLKYVVYTMGSKGSILLSGDYYSVMKAPEVAVVDTVGAGDAFIAVLVSGLLHRLPLDEVHENATEAAAIVCTQKGATLPSESR